MSPENTHRLMVFYTEVLTLGIILQYLVSASLAVPIGCIGLAIHPIGTAKEAETKY